MFFTAAGDLLLGAVIGSDAVAHLVIQFTAPSIIPFTYLYFLRIQGDYEYRSTQLLWVTVPVMLLTAGLILTALIGLPETDALLERIHADPNGGAGLALDGLEHSYYIWTVIVFRIMMEVEMLFLVIYCIVLGVKYHFNPRNIWGFLARGRRIRVLELQVANSLLITVGLCIKLFLHDQIIRNLPLLTVGVAVFISLLLFCFGLIALLGAREFISISDIRTALRFNYKPATRAHVTETIMMDMADGLSGESLTHVLSKIGVRSSNESARGSKSRAGAPSLAAAIFNVVNLSHDTDGLLARFQRLMVQEQLFLRPGLTLNDVAQRLDSNKTYVSKMVNHTYKLGFPEVLNILRVDYAEQYIRQHEDASQEEIAQACGFRSASSFNSTFKRITGYTPKVWSAQES